MHGISFSHALARVAVAGLALSFMATAVAPAVAAEEEIRIIRDKFGVPHVFAPTEEGAAYGVGYALAQDRLWQMHVFRRIAKGRLSEIFGPSVVATDKTVDFWTYTEAERAKRFESWPEDLKGYLQAFVDGINAWIAEVRSDPSKMPFEFIQYGEENFENWTIDDSIALEDVLILSFGSGGGNELRHAQLLIELIRRFGKKKACLMFNDLILTEDPDGPITIPRSYPYAQRPTFGRDAESSRRRGLTRDARLSLTDPTATPAPSPSGGESNPAVVSNPSTCSQTRHLTPAANSTFEQLRLIPDLDAAREAQDKLDVLHQLQRTFRFGSNAQIVGPKLSESGNAAQTGGPQVGYLVPQWLVDFGIHGGSIDATGMTFAGAGPAVLIGRGEGYAWTTTTGASDMTDVYVEKLNPANKYEYLFNGRYEKMDCRTEEYRAKGVAPVDRQEICRTRHGPVLSFDTENGVAYSVRYAWFNRETQTIEGFFRFQQSNRLEDFATYANYLASNHNMFYTDDQGNYGYWHPGNHVVRAPGIDLRLPQDGTGSSEWLGLIPLQQIPHAVNFDRGWLSNWNNQPAVGWKRERAYSAIDNATDLEHALNPKGRALRDPLGSKFSKRGTINPDGKVDFDDLSANLRYGAFKHHAFTYFRPFLPREKSLKEIAKKALEVVRSWDGFLTDTDNDGMYDSAAPKIVDRWIAIMRTKALADDLGLPTAPGTLWSWGSDNTVWHALKQNDRVELKYDWLGRFRPGALARQAFVDAVTRIAEEEENNSPVEWKQRAALQHYQRINADVAGDLADQSRGDASQDSGRPGDVRDHIRMDRGTYNHVVVYLDSPGSLGESKVNAGSVIPPGQSGFISPTGQEDKHYEDQLALYEEWRYKAMPMTLAQVLAVKESEETITRTVP